MLPDASGLQPHTQKLPIGHASDSFTAIFQSFFFELFLFYIKSYYYAAQITSHFHLFCALPQATVNDAHMEKRNLAASRVGQFFQFSRRIPSLRRIFYPDSKNGLLSALRRIPN